MNSNNETDLQGLASLLKYEPPLDITHKIASYQQQLFKPTQKEAKPSPEGHLPITQTYSISSSLQDNGHITGITISSTSLTTTLRGKMWRKSKRIFNPLSNKSRREQKGSAPSNSNSLAKRSIKSFAKSPSIVQKEDSCS